MQPSSGLSLHSIQPKFQMKYNKAKRSLFSVCPPLGVKNLWHFSPSKRLIQWRGHNTKICVLWLQNEGTSRANEVNSFVHFPAHTPKYISWETVQKCESCCHSWEMLTVSQIDTSYPFDLFSSYQCKWFKRSPQVVIWLTIRIWYFLNFLT